MNSSPRFRLFLMMVLEIAIWGAWLPLIFGYLPSLGFSASAPPAAIKGIVEKLPWFLQVLFSEQGMILNAFPLAAIVGLFFSNQFADRNFAAEKFLAFSHLIGGAAILGCGFTREIAGALGLASPFWPFFWLMLIHCLLYVPTIAITNSIAFTHMKDPQREFGIIRMGGTFGWILVALPFAFILVDWPLVETTWANMKLEGKGGFVNWLDLVLGSGLTGERFQAGVRSTYIAAGCISFALVLFSFALPHTPPKTKIEGAAEKLAWLEAVKLLKHPFVLILFLVTFVDSFVHNLYFNWTGSFLTTVKEAGGVGISGNLVMPVMTIGQFAEIFTMLVLGVTLKTLGWRWTMIIGILGHAARFAVYAFFPHLPWVIVGVQILHGICYAFFFATVYIFVDEHFPKDVRASAQGLFNFMILGLGALVANSIGPRLIQEVFVLQGGGTDFFRLFLVPCYAALGAAVALLLLFHPPKIGTSMVARGEAPPH